MKKPKITITTAHPASRYGRPVCLLDGKPADDADGLQACRARLGLTIPQLAELTGRSTSAIGMYLYGHRPVPAQVWNVLAAKLN